MAAAAAGIFNHQLATAAQAIGGTAAAPAANSTTGTTGADSSSDSSSGSATISANDFLTLLVTEMQNQDPTADTDPNEYINQLVQVNSLEQLIDINQTLSTGLSGTPASSGTGASGQTAGATSGSTAVNLNGAAVAAMTATRKGNVLSALHSVSSSPAASAAQPSAAHYSPGNLSVPGVNRAAQRVAHSLAGRTHAASGG